MRKHLAKKQKLQEILLNLKHELEVDKRILSKVRNELKEKKNSKELKDEIKMWKKIIEKKELLIEVLEKELLFLECVVSHSQLI